MVLSVWLYRFSILCILSACFLSGMLFFIFNNKLIDFSMLEHYNPGKPTIILDDEGKEWTRFQVDRREPVTIEYMPKHLLHAFFAAEDHEFYHHLGISWKGMIRASLVNLYNGKKMQGASTITQQLVKLLFFSSRKTFERKFKEQFYALLVERQFTKDQILQTYLNHVFFGAGIYGVEAACQRFWGISVKDISVEQAAVLAGIVRSPNRYCPLYFPLSSQRRRNVVLQSMLSMKHITQEQYDDAIKKPLILTQSHQDELASHLKETLRQQLEDLVGRQRLYSGGLIVQTTLNQKMQKEAQKVFYEQFEKMKKAIHVPLDGALISMDIKTGGIKALIGGRNFANSKFNRAFQARRQMGSIFKPIVYAAAIQQGRSFTEIEVDEPFELIHNNQVWAPQNYNRQFEGAMTLARALSYSNNIVTIKTLLQVGCDTVKKLGEKFRIPNLQPYPSLALGCVDVTLKEAIASFNVFANGGVYVEPYFISWIKDEWGNKIHRHKLIKERILDQKVNDQVAKVLSIGMERMRKRIPEKWFAADAIGKTGTTNDCRTCWFAGSTPSITTAAYIGCDDNRSMGQNVYPIRTAFPIWFGLHRSFNDTKKKFSLDSSLQEILINAKTGQPCADSSHPLACSILISSH